MSGEVRVLEFRPMRRASLCGFAKVQLPSGLIIAEIAIHVAGSKTWAQAPGRPMLDRDGVALRGEDGKVRYTPIIGFANHGMRASWSRQIVAAIRESHPEALDQAQQNARDPEPEPAPPSRRKFPWDVEPAR